jgi:hypothetical protein
MSESRRVYVTPLDYQTACAAFERVFVRYAQQYRSIASPLRSKLTFVITDWPSRMR